jgi:hypothetical protein
MSDSTIDRRRILKHLAATFAVGAGLTAAGQSGQSTAAPPRRTNGALATTTWRCCAAPLRCGTCNDPDKVRYYCNTISGPCPDYCSGCVRFKDDCYRFSADSCP